METRANYLLAARELELGSPERLHNSSLVLVRRTDAHNRLTDADTGYSALGFAKSSTHSSLEPVKEQSQSDSSTMKQEKETIPIGTGTA